MKKLFLTMALCLTATLCVSAQDVYKEILRLSRETADDTSKDLQTRKVATFKVDELEYMMQRTREMLPDSLMTNIINEQAYAMYEFVNTFVTLYNGLNKKKERQEVMAVFKEASLNNPRFHDDDTELTLAYINNEGYITTFSLDTDWVLALAEVKKKLKEML